MFGMKTGEEEAPLLCVGTFQCKESVYLLSDCKKAWKALDLHGLHVLLRGRRPQHLWLLSQPDGCFNWTKSSK